jgi:hypothetical protein
MVDALNQQFQVKQDVLFAVGHFLDNADVVPLEEIPFQL